MNIKILVTTHKEFQMRQESCFLPIHCGKAISDEELPYIGDNTGDNISNKNKNYCELTALYWAWKNLKDVDVVGLFHYRRYLALNEKSISPIYAISESEYFETEDFNENDVFKILKNHDIILSKQMSMLPISNTQQYACYHNREDINILEQVIKDVAPDYYKSYFDYMNRWYKYSPYNIFICKRRLMDDYCSWLFPILEETEKRVRIEHYSEFQARIFGFMGEYLLNVYVFHHKLKAYYAPVYFIDNESANNSNYKKHLSGIFRMFRSSMVWHIYSSMTPKWINRLLKK